MTSVAGHAYGPATAWASDFASVPASVLSKRSRRLDAESYLTSGYGIRLELEAAIASTPLGDLSDSIWQPDRLKGVLVDPSVGLPFLAAGQVFDIRPTPRKWLAASQVGSFASRIAEPGLILITRSGTVGRAILSYGAHGGSVLTDDLLRLRISDPDTRGFVYAFLRSHYGRTMLEAPQYGSIVKHLEVGQIAELPVPTLTDAIRSQVGNLVAEAYRLRDEAFALLIAAENEFEHSFPALEPEPSVDYLSTPAAALARGRRRLEGQYHSQRTAAIERALAQGGGLVEPLGKHVERVFGVPRFKHVYQSDGIPYLDSEDLFTLLPDVTKFIPEVTHKHADRYMVESGWLLMACSGQTYGLNGNCVIATPWHQDKVISNHVIRIVPGDVPVGYLRVALGHPRLGRPLVTRLAFGSEVPEIAPQDLMDIPLVRLDAATESRLGQMMQQSYEARDHAERLETAAITIVEEAIDVALGTLGSGRSNVDGGW